MNINNLQQKIRNIGLVLSLVFSFVLLSSVDAKAQYQDPNYYPQSRRNDDHHKNKHKHDKRGNGNYNRGNRDNDRDGDYDDDRDDRDDDNGRYDRNRNNNDNGYYDRNGNYHPNNNNGNYGNNRNGNNIYRIAQQNGYNDGLRKGAEDARENHSNPQGTSEYKRATNGYNSSYGNKEQYKQAYRQAFLQGFDEAQNRGYNNRNGSRRTNSAGSIFRQIIRGY